MKRCFLMIFAAVVAVTLAVPVFASAEICWRDDMGQQWALSIGVVEGSTVDVFGRIIHPEGFPCQGKMTSTLVGSLRVEGSQIIGGIHQPVVEMGECSSVTYELIFDLTRPGAPFAGNWVNSGGAQGVVAGSLSACPATPTPLPAAAVPPPFTLQPRTWDVDCTAGGTINGALRWAKPGDTIQVQGTCNETVTITTDDLTLEGVENPIIDGGGSDQAVITIDGARRVTIQGVTVRKGVRGILAIRGAAVTLESVTAEDNTDKGIRLIESTARLTDCTVLRSGDDGIRVARTSSATFTGTIVSNNNAGRGILAALTSNILFGIGATVTANDNGDNGIRISDHSTLRVVGGTVVIQNNARHGIMVQGSSHLRVTRGVDEDITVVIQSNSAGGILVVQNSFVQFGGTGFSAKISTNGGGGVIIKEDSSVRLGQGTEIRDNTGVGLQLTLGSEGYITNVVVQDNGAEGIKASGASMSMRDSTIIGNGGADVALSFGTRADLTGNTIGILPITCDETVISVGDTICP